MTPRLDFCAFASAALFLASITLTETGSAQTEDAQRKARILYQKGNAAFKKGDSILARDYYKKSLALYESFDTVCNLGRAQAQDKLFVDAYESLVWCGELYPEDEELSDARIKFIRLRDEVRTEISPLEQREVDKRVQEEIERRRQQEAEAARSAAEPSASAVQPSAPPPTTIKKRSPAALPVSLTIGGIGVVGLGLGTGFLIDSLGKKDDADGLRSELRDDGVDCSTSSDSRCDRLEEDIEKRDLSANISTASFIAGGVLVAGGILTYVFWPKTRSVEVGDLRVYDPQPLVIYDRRTGQFQFGLNARF